MRSSGIATRFLRGHRNGAIHCHASTYLFYRRLGEGDIILGFERMNQMTYPEARELVSHPVGCIDCHNSETMQLRVTRPAFIEGIRTLKAQEGIPDYSVNTDATRQEMRSFVCGQCHVEYYFQDDEKRLVYPWANGLRVENILAYYNEIDFADWSHADSGARVLKTQHPEFEMWNHLDFVEAENSSGFHAPQEAPRILVESIDFTRRGQVVLRDSLN